MSTIDQQSPTTPLLLVCKAAHEWMLPFLYHSPIFTTSEQLCSFLYTHDIPNDPIQSRFQLIRSMHIGPTPFQPGNLQYGSTNWPLTIVTRILWLSRACKRLFILNVDQNRWHTLEHAIPGTLTHLVLGPIHGPFLVHNLKQNPPLKMFTTCLTYMRDNEIQDLVFYPSMRYMRRLLNASTDAPHWMASQMDCVKQSRNMEKVEIVIFGREDHRQFAVDTTVEQLRESGDADDRVIVSQDRRDWLRILFDEFEAFRVGFILSHMQ